MTIDPKYFELIQADIDGEIDDAGKAELESFLADSEEGLSLIHISEPTRQESRSRMTSSA